LVAAERGWFRRRTQGVGAAGWEALWGNANFAEDLISAIETRALWARFGL